MFVNRLFGAHCKLCLLLLCCINAQAFKVGSKKQANHRLLKTLPTLVGFSTAVMKILLSNWQDVMNIKNIFWQ